MKVLPRFKGDPPKRDVPNLQNRLWFPLEEGRVDSSNIVDIVTLRKDFAGIMPPKIRSCFSLIDPKTVERIKRMDLFPAAVFAVTLEIGRELALIIPTRELGDEWKFDFTVTVDSLRFISVIVALRIRHSNNYEGNVAGSNQPMYDLNRGEGNCFSKASILCAVLRKNGIDARIVGHLDFHESNSPHFWVEALIDGSWIGLDTGINNFALISAKFLIDSLPSNADKIKALVTSPIASFLLGLNATSIESDIYREKVQCRFIAAEFAIPQLE